MNPMLPDIARVLITEEDLQRRVQELAEQISADYENLNPLLVCVLKGGVCVSLRPDTRHDDPSWR